MEILWFRLVCTGFQRQTVNPSLLVVPPQILHIHPCNMNRPAVQLSECTGGEDDILNQEALWKETSVGAVG